MKEADLIVFDIDGTLVDSREDITNSVNFTLKKLGLKEKGLEEIASYIGRGVTDLIKRSLGEKSEDLTEKAMSIFEEYYKKHFNDHSRLYPGVEEVLRYFADKKKVILTNRKYDYAVMTLKSLGIYGYFEEILGGDNTGCAKPSSCPLDALMEKLNVDKKRAIMVGDMDIDVLAGKEAGIATCAVTYGIGSKKDIVESRPDYIIDSITKLKDIVR